MKNITTLIAIAIGPMLTACAMDNSLGDEPDLHDTLNQDLRQDLESAVADYVQCHAEDASACAQEREDAVDTLQEFTAIEHEAGRGNNDHTHEWPRLLETEGELYIKRSNDASLAPEAVPELISQGDVRITGTHQIDDFVQEDETPATSGQVLQIPVGPGGLTAEVVTQTSCTGSQSSPCVATYTGVSGSQIIWNGWFGQTLAQGLQTLRGVAANDWTSKAQAEFTGNAWITWGNVAYNKVNVCHTNFEAWNNGVLLYGSYYCTANGSLHYWVCGSSNGEPLYCIPSQG